MARITVEDCLQNEPNLFNLVLLAAKRARRLANGAEATVEWENDKPTVVALREIAAGNITLEMLEEPEEPVQQPVKLCESLATLFGADALGEIPHRLIGLRQCGVAQKQARPEPLDGAAHHAIGVLRLDFAVDLDPQFLERAVGGEDMGDIAEGVFVGSEPRIGRHVDAPAPDILAFVVARRQAKHLDHAGCGRIVAVDRAMGDVKAHGEQVSAISHQGSRQG